LGDAAYVRLPGLGVFRRKARTSLETYALSDVYGISREVPLNYVPRPEVDGLLVDSLTRDKHIVIYGSSKQGKTCLRKWNLKDHEYITVTCSNTWSLDQLQAAILKAAGYTIEATQTHTLSGATKIAAKVGGKLRSLIAEASVEAGVESTDTDTVEIEERSLELDPTDVNDIILALQEIAFSGFIVLEDFHYLSDETQTNFAVALKAFHESSHYTFIIVGVWLDENRLIQHNGDLTGRVIAINADAWSPTELAEVISTGEGLLNVEFAEAFRDDLIEGCFESVSVVQEVCYWACESSGVHQTQADKSTIAGDYTADIVIKDVIDSQSGRYRTFVTNFAEGFMETRLKMYRWLLLPVLLADPKDLEQHGIRLSDINQMLRQYHPQREELNPGNVTQALISTASLQITKLNIKPIVLDYDQSNRRLEVVDKGFLIWLTHQGRDELLEAAGLEGYNAD
jgi:hypothetical protein